MLTQQIYVETILGHFGMVECHPMTTLMEKGIKLQSNMETKETDEVESSQEVQYTTFEHNQI
jgi:hypothetical protein